MPLLHVIPVWAAIIIAPSHNRIHIDPSIVAPSSSPLRIHIDLSIVAVSFAPLFSSSKFLRSSLGMAVWNDLPQNILYIIAQYFTTIEDFASFSAVSRECQFVAASLKKKASLPPRYPRLMLAENQNDSIRGFVNLPTSKTFGVELPEAKGKYCVGAQYGWLFTLGSDLQINLLHPFSKKQISLPPMLTFPDQYEYHDKFPPQRVLRVFVRKVAISASPLKGNNLNDDCVIVAIYGEVRILAFARLGDTVWTNIEVPSLSYTDVIYYKGKFYATDVHGVVIVCDIDKNNCPKATVVAYTPLDARDAMDKYLVESCGHLLLVSRWRGETCINCEDDVETSMNCEDGEETSMDGEEEDSDSSEQFDYEKFKLQKMIFPTEGFSIWRLDESSSGDYIYKLTKVTTLGDRALFFGGNVSTSKASSDGIKANCIYFADDSCEYNYLAPGGGGADTGIFNMEDGAIQFAYAGDSRSPLSPPIWYM